MRQRSELPQIPTLYTSRSFVETMAANADQRAEALREKASNIENQHSQTPRRFIRQRVRLWAALRSTRSDLKREVVASATYHQLADAPTPTERLSLAQAMLPMPERPETILDRAGVPYGEDRRRLGQVLRDPEQRRAVISLNNYLRGRSRIDYTFGSRPTLTEALTKPESIDSRYIQAENGIQGLALTALLEMGGIALSYAMDKTGGVALPFLDAHMPIGAIASSVLFAASLGAIGLFVRRADKVTRQYHSSPFEPLRALI